MHLQHACLPIGVTTKILLKVRRLHSLHLLCFVKTSWVKLLWLLLLLTNQFKFSTENDVEVAGFGTLTEDVIVDATLFFLCDVYDHGEVFGAQLLQYWYLPQELRFVDHSLIFCLLDEPEVVLVFKLYQACKLCRDHRLLLLALCIVDIVQSSKAIASCKFVHGHHPFEVLEFAQLLKVEFLVAS